MERPLNDRVRFWLTTLLGIVTVCAGGAFIYKVVEFITSLEDLNILGFAVAPLANYFCVAGGFFSLLIWAFLSGQFSDPEQAKLDFLADQERYDREESMP
ncbi:MAG: hypothetical protein EYC70_02360 [Planctomycetota bacterium]|nr:MAG: hypothetical protein EYC70_02360 [Planctomycetota bacterium]